jgi:DsbC/DsbD-like thiol-disulfide interchange protein
MTFGKLLLTGVAALLSVAAFAQSTPPKASLRITSKALTPGSVIKGEVTVTFGDGLHGYQNPPSDEFSIPVSLKLATADFTGFKPTYPAGSDFSMDGKVQKVYMGTVKIPFTAKLPTKPGKYSLKIAVNYQQCTASECFPPDHLEAAASVQVAKGGPAKKH